MTGQRGNSQLDDAIVAFVGRGSRKTPSADEAAVRALGAERAEQLLFEVKRVLAVSDSITVDDRPSNAVRDAVTRAHRELLPGLSERAVHALVWRWAFIRFHG